MGESILKELDMAFVSIGQKYGFVSAGDVFRQRQAEALAEGISNGRKEGESRKTRSLAKGFLKKGVSVETIAEVTGLTIDEIKAL